MKRSQPGTDRVSTERMVYSFIKITSSFQNAGYPSDSLTISSPVNEGNIEVSGVCGANTHAYISLCTPCVSLSIIIQRETIDLQSARGV